MHNFETLWHNSVAGGLQRISGSRLELQPLLAAETEKEFSGNLIVSPVKVTIQKMGFCDEISAPQKQNLTTLSCCQLSVCFIQQRCQIAWSAVVNIVAQVEKGWIVPF